MSSRAENWAWERDDVKGITKFVLVYLAAAPTTTMGPPRGRA